MFQINKYTLLMTQGQKGKQQLTIFVGVISQYSRERVIPEKININ